jgi:periplasmic protein TonB
VTDAPKATTRVAPHVPAELKGTGLNEVVIARVLVSHTGYPALVGLLRHSKAGLALDEAVIAAVKQWRFSPARKRGEAVSCWLNVAVTVKGD